MAYLTQQDLIDRFALDEIEDLAPDGSGGLDAVKIAAAIADAGNEIDIYLTSGGYGLPLSNVPPVVTSYACDIARYRLYDNEATEQVNKRYERAIKFLQSVADGKIKLSANNLDLSGDSQTVGEAQFEGGRQVFNGGGF